MKARQSGPGRFYSADEEDALLTLFTNNQPEKQT
jgi:hypothetical protein